MRSLVSSAESWLLFLAIVRINDLLVVAAKHLMLSLTPEIDQGATSTTILLIEALYVYTIFHIPKLYLITASTNKET